MTGISEVTTPGIMISQAWPNSRESEGSTLRGIETVLEQGFFQAFQTVEIPYPKERKKIAGLMRSEGKRLTYCIARVLNENSLNLSDLDNSNRRRSIRQAVRCLDDAREAGAAAFALISGPRPRNPTLRPEALKRLADSLVPICQAATEEPSLQVVLEPLDFAAHKKASLGMTTEAVQICNAPDLRDLVLTLCLDTAHLLLNHEDPVKALALARPHVTEYHFCNCVIDTADPLFGDRHLPFGTPGVIDVEAFASILGGLESLEFLSTQTKPPIFCEVLKRPQDKPLEVVKHCQKTLVAAWKRFENTKGDRP